MLKKVILGIIVGAVIMTTSAGFLYAYQKESGTRENYYQKSNIESKNDSVCTNENCLNYGTNQDCNNTGDCINCQNNQDGQGLQNGQKNENCTGTCINSNNGNSNENGNTNLNRYRNKNNDCNEFSIQNMSKNRFQNNK